jgi:FkbM family methyltransferase
MLRAFRKAAWLTRNYLSGYYDSSHVSYSQTGEDMIARAMFERLSIRRPSYLDIGGNDPFFLSNTAFFYLTGSKGVVVEPNRELVSRFGKVRRRDTVLHAGVGWDSRSSATFYLFDPNVLSTFDSEVAMAFERQGKSLVSQEEVKLCHINTILDQYFIGAPVNLLSLDIEGGESSVLGAMDFTRHRPEIIIVETWQAHAGTFNKDSVRVLEENGYVAVVNLKPNQIFVTRHAAEQLC